MELPARVLALLQERGQTLATAESLTGGRLASALTGVPGASKSYVGGAQIIDLDRSAQENLASARETDKHKEIDSSEDDNS